MVKTKTQTLTKRTIIAFEQEDIKLLVAKMLEFIKTGEIFEVFLEDNSGNEVLVTLNTENAE